MAHFLPQTVNDIPTSRHQPESSDSPARFTGPRGIGFNSKRNFKAVLKAASFSLHQDDYDIHSGVGPEPRYILGPHPESKRLIFRDMNFEIYNPKVGYTNSSGRKARLFEQLYEKHRKHHRRDRNKEEVSPDSKLFGNMLERTPLHNLKFTDRLAMELEAEEKLNRETEHSPQKDNSPHVHNPLRAMRGGYEPPKYLFINKENSTLEKSPLAQGSAETHMLPLIRKRNTSPSPNKLKLEPIQQRILTRRRPSEDPNVETFARFNKRNHSMDVPPSESKLALNVSKVSFVEAGEHQLTHESSKKSIPQDNKSTLTERSPKKAQKELRQVISKTLFKRPSDGAQGSHMIQRIFYGGIMQKTAAE